MSTDVVLAMIYIDWKEALLVELHIDDIGHTHGHALIKKFKFLIAMQSH